MVVMDSGIGIEDIGGGTGIALIEFDDEFNDILLDGGIAPRFDMPFYAKQTQPRPYIGGNVKEEMITTPYGLKTVTRIEKASPNRGLGGMAIPDFDTYLVNPNSVFPKDYSGHHERNHLREYEETGVPILDELINRDTSDKQYRQITGKFIDTVTPFEDDIEKGLLTKYSTKKTEAIMNGIRSIKNKYVARNMDAVDLNIIAKEFDPIKKIDMPKMPEAPKIASKEPEKEYKKPSHYII